ncbi:hypothetical protein ASH02_16250 [Nocardioides sp. Soil796]|nr:hypothetical protein ASH02_16250 [Nocardioides sp. Soil796]
MRQRATGGQRQHHLAGQCELREQVQPGLEQTRVGRLVDRRRDHHAVRPGQLRDRLGDLRVLGVAGQQGIRRQVEDAQVTKLVAVLLDGSRDVREQPGRPRDHLG